eukprot:421061-Pleurochrysis_carterae.AAC.1
MASRCLVRRPRNKGARRSITTCCNKGTAGGGCGNGWGICCGDVCENGGENGCGDVARACALAKAESSLCALAGSSESVDKRSAHARGAAVLPLACVAAAVPSVPSAALAPARFDACSSQTRCLPSASPTASSDSASQLSSQGGR